MNRLSHFAFDYETKRIEDCSREELLQIIDYYVAEYVRTNPAARRAVDRGWAPVKQPISGNESECQLYEQRRERAAAKRGLA